jgi:hypothetical protein
VTCDDEATGEIGTIEATEKMTSHKPPIVFCSIPSFCSGALCVNALLPGWLKASEKTLWEMYDLGYGLKKLS